MALTDQQKANAKKYRDSVKGKAGAKKYRQGDAGKASMARQQKNRVASGWDKDNKRKRYSEDPIYRNTKILRVRFEAAMKGKASDKTARALLGCSVEELLVHLNDQFTEGMTWENQGEWHIDHIKPCASFDLTIEEERNKCFHFTNMQPLWALENLKKSYKY